MGILSSFLWMLAGGSYLAGSGAKNLIKSADYAPISYEHDDLWYRENWRYLNHKRQRELCKMYKENFSEFVALGAYVNEYTITDRYYDHQTHFGDYYSRVAWRVAWFEGWKYDKNPALKLSPYFHEFEYNHPTSQEVKLKSLPDIHSSWQNGIPWIGENNNWWLNGEDTGVWAIPDNEPIVCEDGTWQIGDIKTGIAASDKITRPGGMPQVYIKKRNWYIGRKDSKVNSVDTGIPATEQNKLELRDDNYYWCGDTKTRFHITRSPNYFFENGNWAYGVHLWVETDHGEYPDTSKGCFHVDTGIPVTIRRYFKVNPDRESQLYALYEIAQDGAHVATEELSRLYNGDICLDDKHDFCWSAIRGNQYAFERTQPRSISEKEGWVPLYYDNYIKDDSGKVYNGWWVISDMVKHSKEWLRENYYNHDRQTELWRTLYYARKGNKDAKLDYYRLTDEGYEEIIEAFGEGDYLDDIELDETNFGKDGVALYEFNRVAKSEGWLLDDSYPSTAKQKQLEQMFEREKSYADPTPLPWNHERQEEIYKARFCATELKDKTAQKSLLMFTGARNSARLSEEKFFKLCSECAKEEGWAWDFDYLTPTKCREIIRECVGKI